MRAYMGIPVTYKIGVETFNHEFRERVLNKHAGFKRPEEVARYFDSPCIMVGIKGQTKEMIDYDIRMVKKHFRLGTVSVFTNNTTKIRQDPELVKWFVREYAWLREDPSIGGALGKYRFRSGRLKVNGRKFGVVSLLFFWYINA